MIDKSKKSNRKCENCEHFVETDKRDSHGFFLDVCDITQEKKYYYNRCKNFEWSSRKEYKGSDTE